ncbi:hypothetical protein [Geminocystis sp. GBBB08]|uniref:hypothetical protein n=1 Tax=Geminocystis sp. GBBB08 TaxID=2604140 RepID=UPI0027E28550|nr:hypothetical protein [Geminocystis sp. GBBB08]MBL1209261.1 hypothetical protein [Geminocystis sp. GBBB08]
MNSKDLAKYIESIDGISKPWLLAQIRLKKLEENKPFLSPDEYLIQLKDIHQDVMNLGEWWLTINN